MRLILILLSGYLVGTLLAQLLYLATSHAEIPSRQPKYKIAIFDTGYDISNAGPVKLKLCKTGHYDFHTHKAEIGHTLQHGTQVASIIAESLKNVDYCAVVFQMYDYNENAFSFSDFKLAVDKAIHEHVSVVNMSFNGYQYSKIEDFSLQRLSNSGAVMFVAAGNENHELDQNCDAYPACLNIDNLNAVGALEPGTNLPTEYTNFGSHIKAWASGMNNLTHNPRGGTSMAAPKALSRYVLELDRKQAQTVSK